MAEATDADKKRRDVDIMLQRLEAKKARIKQKAVQRDSEETLPQLNETSRRTSSLMSSERREVSRRMSKRISFADAPYVELMHKMNGDVMVRRMSRARSIVLQVIIQSMPNLIRPCQMLPAGTWLISKTQATTPGTASARPDDMRLSNKPSDHQSPPTRKESTIGIRRKSTLNATLLWQSSFRLINASTVMQKGGKTFRRQLTSRKSIVPREASQEDGDSVRRNQILKKFRHAVRMVLILKKWSFEIAKTIDANRLLGKYSTFTDLAEASEQAASSGVSSDLGFDVNYYKARKLVTLSNEVKDILALPPKLRSSEQIMTVIYGIRNHPSFAEYPHHMQEKLCKVARYEMVPAKRVIIRQGHYGQNFYFIISGQAIVKVMDTNPLSGEETVRTAAILKDGDSFGEIALLHHVRRTATVVSRDVIHLLTIGREDFSDIFVGELSPIANDQIHIQFLSKSSFMKGWPIEKLMKHKDYCIMHYFKKGRVIVEDSKNTEWIYVVKSGSCLVMKHMRETMPKCVWKKKVRVDRSKDLPRPGTSEQSPRVDDWRRTPRAGRTVSSRSLGASPDPRSTLFKLTNSTTPAPLTRSNTVMTLPRLRSPRNFVALPGMSTYSGGGVGLTTAARPGFSDSKLDLSYVSSSSKATVSFADETSFIERLPDSVNHGNRRQGENTHDEEVDFYLKVHVLESGDTFGLADLQFDDDVDTCSPSMSLVSQGAEVIMLKKQFFITYSDEEVKENLRRNCDEYPSESVIRGNLKVKLNWDQFRGTLMRNVLDRRGELHLLRQRSVTGF